MNHSHLYERRLRRILRAVALEEPDRTPVVLEYSAFAARATGAPMAQFADNPAKATEMMIRAYRLIGGGDAINYGSFSPYWLCYSFGSKVKVPGVELPEDEIWQVFETELMSSADYHRILKEGWPGFFRGFMADRILSDVPPERLPWRQERFDVRKAWAACDLPVLSGPAVTTPIELLFGARSMAKFTLDLYDIPDEIEAVMNAMIPHLAASVCRQARKQGYPAAWIGGWRAAPAMLSPPIWDRFVWPYFSRLVREVVEVGLVAILHMDSCWDRELSRFRELPKGRCIMAVDGATDLFKAKEVLGDHMCLMGDVPATMLCLGHPDEVYNYCSRLIRELGPKGFILQSGCDIPAEAKLENVKAMVAAAVDK